MKNFEEVISLNTVRDAIAGERPGGAMSKPRETLTIHAERSWQLVFANIFEGGRSIVPFLAGLLTGAIKPIFGEDE